MDPSAQLITQAKQMAEAFVNGDYKTFSNYTYPPVLQMMEGSAKFVAALNEMVEQMKAKGFSFSQVTFDDPSAIVRSNHELQATIGIRCAGASREKENW